MEHERHREPHRRVSIGRAAVAAAALGGLSASTLMVTTAGAARGHHGKATTRPVVISTTKNAKLGRILVSRTTVYVLTPSQVACGSQCLQIWPAVVLPRGVKKATAGSGVQQSKLGSIKLAGGVLQVTYAGKALYWFSGDTGPGQVNGNITDEWGKWTTVALAKPAANSGSNAGSGATNAGTGGASF